MKTLTQNGSTRWQHAVEQAKGLLDSGGPTTEFRLIDTSGITASAFTTDRNELRKMIDQMSPKTAERSSRRSIRAIRRSISSPME